MTSAELLLAVNNAIAQLLAGGEEVTLPTGVRFRMASLSSLEKLRDQLKSEVDIDTAGGGGGFVSVNVGGVGGGDGAR